MQNTPGNYMHTISEEGNVRFAYLITGIVGISIGDAGQFRDTAPIKYEEFIRMANDIIREHENMRDF